MKTGSTTVSPTTVKTTPATNKTVCSSAQPQNHSLMRENPISVAILLRTGESFQGERQTLINSFPGLLTSIKSNPGRIKNYLLAPFVDSSELLIFINSYQISYVFIRSSFIIFNNSISNRDRVCDTVNQPIHHPAKSAEFGHLRWSQLL